MGKVIFVISMSLDGYVTAANQTPDNPMGDGGLRLQEWAFSADETNQQYLAAAVDGLGAVIAGRRTYDTSLRWWGADGPSGPARRPVFVVTHEAPEEQPEHGVYQFVTDGLGSALAQAQTAAGDKDVTVMGGADLGRQYLDAGLLDEMEIHLVPVLLGGGTRMFAGLPGGPVQLEPVDVLPTPAATHLRYRILR
ncbi:dihydrofolate reductase family protein [Dactylosporangium sp. NBC_01737]|uniref:dihydrofolate reductase family protein n=1 Tax=Dactylosporangium sp. NBC_01737 TaxID=2975959 RepID=UPI002E124E27|nr:dihydrofolate reductase family protein [Dactylosporangium sp. NBC_01737]